MSQFRWAILGTGFVATKFVLGLRAAGDSAAVVAASRSAERAAHFASSLGIPRSCGGYDAAIDDPAVDACYIATPPTAHRDLAIRCLQAGKAVLVEKPFAVSGAEARAIAAAAGESGTFCMEAMWTRFLPAVREAKRRIDAGELGDIRLVMGSFGIAEVESGAHPLFDPSLGGGALLDRAVYPISLAWHLVGAPTAVTADATFASSGVEDQVAIVLRYERGALAVLSASLSTDASNVFELMGTRGRLRLEAPIYRPSRVAQWTVQATPRGAPSLSRSAVIKESGLVHQAYQRLGGVVSAVRGGPARSLLAYSGNGYGHQAVEVERCVRAGLRESPLMPLSESVAIVELMDQVRAQWASRVPTSLRNES